MEDLLSGRRDRDRDRDRDDRHKDCDRRCGGIDDSMLIILLLIIFCCNGFGGNDCRCDHHHGCRCRR